MVDWNQTHMNIWFWIADQPVRDSAPIQNTINSVAMLRGGSSRIPSESIFCSNNFINLRDRVKLWSWILNTNYWVLIKAEEF